MLSQVSLVSSLVAQSTPTVLPAPEADEDADADGDPDPDAQAQAQAEVQIEIGVKKLRRKEICFSIFMTSCDLLLEEIFWFSLSPFLDKVSTSAYMLMVDELVSEIYDRYVESQEDLPLEERRMPEPG
jgi:hypothetical protein